MSLIISSMRERQFHKTNCQIEIIRTSFIRNYYCYYYKYTRYSYVRVKMREFIECDFIV